MCPDGVCQMLAQYGYGKDRFAMQRANPDGIVNDDDPVKWRSLGVEPIIISAGEPRHSSAVVRLAYTDDALYVQVIKFAHAFSFRHTNARQHYQQDGFEVNIGTYWSGWKYNVTRLGNKADIFLRDRFISSSDLLMPDQAPRYIGVLDSALNVLERKLLEATGGVDMSGDNVMVTM